MAEPAPDRRHAARPGARTDTRTYVVLACAPPFDPGAVTPVGTVAAPSRDAARALAGPLAAARGGVPADAVPRVVRASGCRRAWLLDALARDGAVHLGDVP